MCSIVYIATSSRLSKLRWVASGPHVIDEGEVGEVEEPVCQSVESLAGELDWERGGKGGKGRMLPTLVNIARRQDLDRHS